MTVLVENLNYTALRLPAGYSALLNSTAVVFGMFASAWMKEDTLTVRKVLGCLCGFAGVALIVGLGPVQLTLNVVLAALACVVCAARAAAGAARQRTRGGQGRAGGVAVDGELTIPCNHTQLGIRVHIAAQGTGRGGRPGVTVGEAS